MRMIILDFASSSSIVPSISASKAGLVGRRTSNNSLTRGRPPVMSPVRFAWTGIRAMMSPALIASPLVTFRVEYTGNRYSAIFLPPREITSPLASTNVIAGFSAFFVFVFQLITLRETIPVMESTSSWNDTFSTKSQKFTIPSVSAMIVLEYGSHSATLAPLSTVSPSFTISMDAYGRAWLNNSWPPSSTTAILPLRDSTTIRPTPFLIVFTSISLMRPATGTSIKWLSAPPAAIPPMWKVRNVN